MFALNSLREWTRPVRFARRVSNASGTANAARIRLRFRDSHWERVDIARETTHVTVHLDRQGFSSMARRRYFLHALPVLVHLFARAQPGSRASAEIGDGSCDTTTNLSFCANHDASLLIPDPDFFETRGYVSARDAAAPAWRMRNPTILWRGSTTGWNHKTRPIDLSDPNCNQRVRVCFMLRDVAGVDAKISSVVEPLDIATDAAILQDAGLLGEMIPATEWLDRQFALDIDGNANAFSNLFVRLLYGCCVIKAGSPRNFRQWYYDRLLPWKHFVPVSADLSDLHERIAWCRSHLDECETIAANGKALATSLTFESEMADAVRRIDARQNSPS